MTRLLLLAPLLLSACAAPALAPAEHTVTVTAHLAVADAAGRRVLEAITPFTADSIDHAVVTLYADGSATPLTSQTLPQTDLGKSITFTNLKQNTTYAIVATAFIPDGADEGEEADPIHDDVAPETTCTTGFTTTTDTLHTITGGIKLKLRNRTFSGSTGGNTLTITPGIVTHSGSEGVSVQ